MTANRAAQLAELVRADLVRLHWPEATLPDATLQRVVLRLGFERHDFAVRAIREYPRPLWLAGIVGPFPFNLDADLVDRRDQADPNEWGHAG